VRNTGVVRTYGQYCPIARGAEIFAERWTPLIIRNLYLGCGSFSEILEGAPGLSRTLLSQRLKQLERLGVVESALKADGRGHRYELTSAGHDLFAVCQSLGEWGARWLEIAPENLDPFVALWSMCNALRRDRLPDRRVVIRFDFLACRSASREGGTGRPPAFAARGRPVAASARSRLSSPAQSGASGGGRHERYWLLIERGDTEICKTYPGLDEDLYITAEAEAFVKWHAGQLTWAQATREGRIQLDGLPSLVRAFPAWNARSMFAHIRPVSRTTMPPAR
jgi:DNA-binding HxlR family transcriptional regulator